MKIKLFLLVLLAFTLIYGEIHYIPDPSNLLYTIQDGIVFSADGDTVLVTPGIYEENINFVGKKITVASEYIFSSDENDIESTIIDGGGDDAVVRMETGEDTLSYLCGFVIRNGNFYRGGGIHISQSGAKLEHLKIRDNIAASPNYPHGGGIFGEGDFYNGSYLEWPQIIMRNVEIDNNSVTGNNPSGGGIFLTLGFNLLLMEDVNVTGNHCEATSTARAGGMCLNEIYNAIIRNCNFTDNSVYSSDNAGIGGISVHYVDNIMIENSKISNNLVDGYYGSTGGISISLGGDAVIRNSLITDNSVDGSSIAGPGGIYLYSNNLLLEDSEIYGNNSRRNGGMFISTDCDVILNRVKIYDNFYTSGAELASSNANCLIVNSIISNYNVFENNGMKIQGGGCYRIVNSIFWDLKGKALILDEVDNVQIYHSIVSEGEDGIECDNGAEYFWGEGNSELDPMFTDPSGRDFHLREDSPGIDNGVNACQQWGSQLFQIPDKEIIGRNRDIGIYETGNEDYHFDLPTLMTTDEDISFSINLSDYLDDMNGDIIVFYENDLESVIVDNIISWQPEENWYGFDEVGIRFEAVTGEIFTDYLLIQVLSVNDAPIIDLPESISFNNIGFYRLDVMQYISDIEQQMISISATGSEHIEVGTHYPVVSFLAEQGWQGTETITVYAEDLSNRLFSSDTIQVEVFCEPIAVCCDDIFTRDGEVIMLDGSACIDPLTNGLNYYWSTDAELEIDDADSALAFVQLPNIGGMEEAIIFLEIDDGFNSSIDSLYLMYWDDEPLQVECLIYPEVELYKFQWEEPAASGCDNIELSGYQIYFEGFEYDSLQNSTYVAYPFNLPVGDYNFGVQAVYSDGASEIVEINSTDADEGELVAVTGLNKIYPNPFNPETTISFSTTEDTEITELTIYNIKGQRVKTLVNEVLSAGEHTTVWKGNDDNGKQVGSGIYFIRLRVGDEVFRSKVVLLK